MFGLAVGLGQLQMTWSVTVGSGLLHMLLGLL